MSFASSDEEGESEQKSAHQQLLELLNVQESSESSEDDSDIEEAEAVEHLADELSDDEVTSDEAVEEDDLKEPAKKRRKVVEEEKDDISVSDPFRCHFEVIKEIPADFEIPVQKVAELQSCKHADNCLMPRLRNQLTLTVKKFFKEPDYLTDLQNRVLNVLGQYKDLYYPLRTLENGEEIRMVYTLHVLNHIVKTRNRIIKNSAKLKQNPSQELELRDQGFTKPRALIVVPFRESVVRIVNLMMSLMATDDKGQVRNKKKFFEEYRSIEDTVPTARKPSDYQATFSGNTDDHFRLGVAVAKKTLKLYTPYYQSDIIIASPLGLRTIIGAEGDQERDYDFLSSIEILIVDQTEIFLMQNWSHIGDVMEVINCQPKESHGVDFSRVRMWAIDGQSKSYRQTVVFSSFVTPEMNSLVHRHCTNWAGRVQVNPPQCPGTICQVIQQIPQTYYLVQASSLANLPDARFTMFKNKIYPMMKDKFKDGTMLFIPSYFDYVRVRNFLKKEEVNFVQMHDYSKDKNIDRARGLFFHRKVSLLVYTERLHYYRRYTVRGIRHLVFYSLPVFSRHYSELCNFVQAGGTVTVIYCGLEATALASVLGTVAARGLVHSGKAVHMFFTEDAVA